MGTKIKVIPRRDKEEGWEQFNPILGEQELVKVFCENGEERFKIGDGKTTYRNLPFVEGNKIEIDLTKDVNWGRYVVRLSIKEGDKS